MMKKSLCYANGKIALQIEGLAPEYAIQEIVATGALVTLVHAELTSGSLEGTCFDAVKLVQNGWDWYNPKEQKQ